MSVDSVFQALGDPTRRALLERLGDGPLSVSELAEPFAVSLAAVVQHLQVLEQSELIRAKKVGRVRICAIAPGGLDIAEQWLQDRRALTERRLDRLSARSSSRSTVRAGGDRRRRAMNTEPINHATFIVERTYRPTPRASSGHSPTPTSSVGGSPRARTGGSRSSPLTSGRPATRGAASDMLMVRRSPTTPATWTSSPTNASCSPT